MKKIILGFILAISFIACGEKPTDPSAISGRIVIADDVKSWLKIERSVMKRDEHNLGHASLLVVNKSKSKKEFFYKITWFDGNGVAIPSIISTRTLVKIQGYDEVAISVPAPNDKATSYSLRITSADND